jgi:3-isopropylmalate/(R)-2-methylmalate dehydratase small subunit
VEEFRRLSSVAIALPEGNIDTDVIFPARFLLIMEKSGLGQYLFYDRRFTPAGEKRINSVLDRPEIRGASILIAGPNFGCGSSREQAVWALAGFGIRCVISTSFGEIFFSNCFKSGVLPIILSEDVVSHLMARADAAAMFDVDLVDQRIASSDGIAVPFEIDPGRRQALLRGWDETDIIFNEERSNIERFESIHASRQPWLLDESA